ncbi:hypothetical protein GE09DRAFT_609358 [Coniochaeta sp. 2T2.1]|nr:hypothetical protein GE09DRAFT_609358 [Coniochaeta sp. 2T2.1]
MVAHCGIVSLLAGPLNLSVSCPTPPSRVQRNFIPSFLALSLFIANASIASPQSMEFEEVHRHALCLTVGFLNP